MSIEKRKLALLSASILMALTPLAGAARGDAGQDNAADAAVEGVKEEAKLKQAKSDLNAFSAALLMYRLNAGNFPSEEQGLAALITRPKVAPIPRRWVQIMTKLPQDPWGLEYRYFIRMKDDKLEHVIASGKPMPGGIELVLGGNDQVDD